ncbi:MAG TPA: carboxymuconolactone decarboxylase family protein [Beijerinckiaceae bacterium]|jgi:4-carboxymuconolactone decarboxylase|nr:carboxymuconolactone decarboxylase family protein [Beijerinckiaceae bacterium]
MSDKLAPIDPESAPPSDPSNWPPDIDPNSGFRLPMLRREDLDEERQRRYDHAASGGNIAGLQGPTAIALYSPKTVAARDTLSHYLRQEAGLGPRLREIALLVTSRSMDTQFEWTAHEPEAIKAGVPQTVIDVIKFHKSTQGLDPVDAIVIDLGRAIWKDHTVGPELFARANAAFGPNKLVDLVLLMGSHATSGALLKTFGMQLHKGKKPLLPIP